jgi:hypothetical protein
MLLGRGTSWHIRLNRFRPQKPQKQKIPNKDSDQSIKSRARSSAATGAGVARQQASCLLDEDVVASLGEGQEDLMASQSGLGERSSWCFLALFTTVAIGLPTMASEPTLAPVPPLPVAPAGGVDSSPATTEQPVAGSAPSYYAGEGTEPDAPRIELSLFDTMTESLFGDVYAAGRWRPLTLGSFFSEGWNESWAGAPAGGDGVTPRHGWLGAFDGVFYRLWLADFNYANNINTPYRGNSYSGVYSVFLPFSRRFEVLLDVPFVTANGTTSPTQGYTSQYGDMAVTPRFLLSESEKTTQVFALGIRTPTGTHATGAEHMALTPRYEFWTNPVGSWVVRGSSGFFVPLNKAETPAQTTFTGGLAAGRYLRPHDVPFGDLVFYGATNFSVPLDGAASTGTIVSVGPGTRFHIAKNFFFLNYWDFPVTGAHADTYSVSIALLKVF